MKLDQHIFPPPFRMFDGDLYLCLTKESPKMSTLMADQTEMKEIGVGQTPHHVLAETDAEALSDLSDDVKQGFTASDQRDMQRMGKKQELRVSIAPSM